MRQLTTADEFLRAERDREHVLIRDNANGPTRHLLSCRNVKLQYFLQKVVENKGRNGSYWVLEPGDQEVELELARKCSACNPPSWGARSSSVRAVAPEVNSASVAAATVPECSGPGATLRWIGNAKTGFEVWCSRQIDLESKRPDPRASARRLILDSLRELRPASDSLLRALFRAEALVPGSDVENVLFTNVDATGSAFRSLVAQGLEFGFAAGDPSGSAPGEGLVCCSTYDWISRGESELAWSDLPVLANWSNVLVPDLGRVSRAPVLWWLLRRARFDLDRSADLPRRFGVDLHVQVPPGHSLNAAARVKPAIDAVVLCLGADDGRSTEEGIAAMAQHAGASANEVRALLLDDSTALLGKHRLVDRRGQVAPPDHGCVRGRLLVEASADEHWRLSAKLVALG